MGSRSTRTLIWMKSKRWNSIYAVQSRALRHSLALVALVGLAFPGCDVAPEIETFGLEPRTESELLAPSALVGVAPDDVTEAVQRLLAREPGVVVTRNPAGGAVEYLRGTLHGPDPRPPGAIARAVVLEHGALFEVDAPEQLHTDEVHLSPRTGYSHVHYVQQLEGVPVRERGLSVHVAPDGSVTAMNGRVEPGLRADEIEPLRLTAADVEDVVRDAYRVVGDFHVFTEPRLEVTLRGGTATRVWTTTVLAPGMSGSVTLDVDASTGAIVHEDTTGFAIQGTGCDQFDNQVTINTTHPVGKPFQLHDKTRPGKFRGYDQGGSLQWTQQDPSSDGDNNWCATSQQFEVSGHSNMAKVLDHWELSYGRNSYDDAGGDLKLGYDALFHNECDDEEYNENVITFPGGIIKLGRKELATLDVLGHEFTHLVLLSEGIDYEFPETRAVHEHVADAFAVFAEHDQLNGNGAWNLVIAEHEPTIVRDLYAPDPAADHYGEFSLDCGTCTACQYQNSQILSYALSLLVTADEHPQSHVAVPWMSLFHLRDIYYEAIDDFVSPGSLSFRQLQQALVASAGANFGPNSPEQHAIEAAFMAVGLTSRSFSLIPFAQDFRTWAQWNTPVTFGSPHASPGVGMTSAKMEDGKLFDGEMMGMTPGAGGLGHVAGNWMFVLPDNVPLFGQVIAPHLEAEVGFPLIAVDTDEALVLFQLRDVDDNVLLQTPITVRRDDDTVDTLDWDLEPYAGTTVKVRIFVGNTGSVPTRPVMLDTLRLHAAVQ